MVAEHLRGASDADLERLMRTRRAALGYAFGHLWSSDADLRRRAAVAVGMGAEANPELGREVLRRILWSLNDESATNGVYAIPALGEIGARRPDLVRDFVAPAASFVWDEGLRLEILRALARIVEAAPELGELAADHVRRYHPGAGEEELDLIGRIVTGGTP